MRRLSLILILLAALAAAFGLFRLSHGYFRSEELSRAEGRLSLYRSTLTAELERFSHLTHVLARDPFVIATAEGGDTDALNRRLADFARRAGLDAIYLMRPDGLTVAASNAGEDVSFIGHNYAFRPYFQQALAGQSGRFYAIGATTGLPGYFIADPVRGSGDQLVGVIAIKVALAGLEDSWRRSGEQVLLANEDGVVLMSSVPGWRYRVLNPLAPETRARIEQARQFPDQPLAPLDWIPRDGRRAEIGGEALLHLTGAAPPHGWGLHYFVADDRAVVRAWLVTGAALALAALWLILWQVQRARRMGRALERSEREEAALRAANQQLAVEIGERRTAERRLTRTQGELERASRLAALGQLAASVTHELGQPIAAMRNHLVAAELSGKAPETVTSKLGGLVDRMEGITRELKFFASPRQEPFETLDLREVTGAAVGLLAPNIEAAEAKIDAPDPGCPILVRGSRFRLEQVVTNLLRNAVDAVEGSEIRQVTLTLGGDEATRWIEIRDTGHGLGKLTLAELQEPFTTTRESGRGMGLGLAISAGILRDHGGEMVARNGKGGGAVFRVTLPAPEQSEEQET
ncbi:sensor histidine kinase [Aliiroseovarius sp.]|uniref:sensor histidine kinase n=1 Tax=Aliiroseovarius sp. TaxID=1872442 RepID=UPI003BABBB5A